MQYVFYPDVFWMTNFIMNLLVLFLARTFRRNRSRVIRIFFASAFGALCAVLLFLNLDSYKVYQILIHFFINPLMLLIAFPVGGIKRFLQDFFLVYIIMLLTGGVMSWGMEGLGQWKLFWIWALGAFVIGVLGLYFWEERREQEQKYEILLLTEERKLALTGFLDTGNLLMDPIMNQPVHIIQENLLEKEFQENRLAIRYIPFHSLGQEQGLLPVVTMKAMYVRPLSQKAYAPIYLEKPVMGLTKEKLFQGKEYQVILNAKGILT